MDTLHREPHTWPVPPPNELVSRRVVSIGWVSIATAKQIEIRSDLSLVGPILVKVCDLALMATGFWVWIGAGFRVWVPGMGMGKGRVQ